MGASVGALIRDGGGISPSPLLAAIKGQIAGSSSWAVVSSTAQVVKIVARLLAIERSRAVKVLVAAYTDARQNHAIEIQGGFLISGVSEEETWATTSEILGHLTGLGVSFQPSIDRLYVRSLWDLAIPLVGTVGTFVASSAVFEKYLPGGTLLWTSVAVGFIAGTAIAQWARKG